MRGTVAALTIALWAGVGPHSLAGQAAPTPGSVLRAYVQMPPISPLRPATPRVLFQGALLSLDADRLILVRESGDTVVLQVATIRQLDLRGRSYRPVRKRAIAGAILGALVGGGIGSRIQVLERCEGSYCLRGGRIYNQGEVIDTANALARGIGLGLVAGGVVGALIGSQTRAYRWIRLDPGHPRLSLVPLDRATGVGASIPF